MARKDDKPPGGAPREADRGLSRVRGLTDVAALLGVTRQNVRKLILACDAPAPAPAPVHGGRPAIWRLVKLLA